MSILLYKVLNSTLKKPKRLKGFVKIDDEGGKPRKIFLDWLYKTVGIERYNSLDTLEIEMLNLTSQFLGINTKCDLKNRLKVIENIYFVYKQKTLEKLEKMGEKERLKFIEEFKKKLNEEEKSFLIDENELFQSFLTKNDSGKFIFAGSAIGIGVSAFALSKIGSKPSLAIGAGLVGLFARIGLPRMLFLGIGGAFAGTILGTMTVFQGYQFIKGRKIRKISTVTLSLILEYEELKENDMSRKNFQYLSGLLEEAKKVKSELLSLTAGGNHE